MTEETTTPPDFTEQARQRLSQHSSSAFLGFLGTEPFNELVAIMASFATEAATQGQIVGIERAAQKCDQLAMELQTEVDAERPLGFIGAVAQQTQARECADDIRALSPDPSYLDRVCNEAATAALEQERMRIREAISKLPISVHNYGLLTKGEVLAAIGDDKQ